MSYIAIFTNHVGRQSFVITADPEHMLALFVFQGILPVRADPRTGAINLRAAGVQVYELGPARALEMDRLEAAHAEFVRIECTPKHDDDDEGGYGG